MRNKSNTTYYLLQTTYSHGQSMIETIVAIFILTSALTAGLGLAIYAFSSAQVSLNEVVATNLAREGVDVMRYMRDTNWLESDKKNIAPYTLADCGGTLCYAKWLEGVSGLGYHNYGIAENSGGSNPNQWRLEFSPSTNDWVLDVGNDYNLYLQSDGINAGSYQHVDNGTVSVFARRMRISYCYTTTTPACANYTVQNPEVIVQSTVAWRGKNCVWAGTDPEAAPSRCKIVVEEHLTNWKDYK